MPELPEVEIVRRDLAQFFSKHPKLLKTETFRADLRFPFPKTLKRLHDQHVLAVRRRGKYLLIEFETHTLLSHLGMTGSWLRQVKDSNHCHFALYLDQGASLFYRDPRRFGFVDVFLTKDENKNAFLKNVGPDALDPNFKEESFFQALKSRKTSIKNLVMNQKIIAGVGNIYACEALFLSGISPKKLAHRVSKPQAFRLLSEIRNVLTTAIEKGGSSISDYVNTEGQKGDFQNSFRVYDRDGQPCLVCQTKIRQYVSAGRSTYFCSRCQT